MRNLEVCGCERCDRPAVSALYVYNRPALPVCRRHESEVTLRHFTTGNLAAVRRVTLDEARAIESKRIGQ